MRDTVRVSFILIFELTSSWDESGKVNRPTEYQQTIVTQGNSVVFELAQRYLVHKNSKESTQNVVTDGGLVVHEG